MIEVAASSLVCAGCGTELPIAVDGPLPFVCPRADGDDVDHVVRRELHRASFPRSEEENPFLAYRSLFVSYQLARQEGLSDAQFVELVQELDARVAEVDGRGFRVTPFSLQPVLSSRVGCEVWVKDETGNVSGSHKARHLMGIAIYLEVLRRLRRESGPRPRLAIASCGNAALAAAVVARAAGYPLEVFIPCDADPTVVERLKLLGAALTVCSRRPGEKGDPCFLRFREALVAGALPFGCQGSVNGLTIEGGQTLGYELLSAGVEPDRIVVQVGGGALGSALVQAMRDGVAMGACGAMPRFHTVQTEGASPLHRAWDRLLERSFDLDHAAAHRSEYMWPWESTPRSAAHGILDDETYDWLELVKGMTESSGHPVTVSERLVLEANKLARETTGIDVDHTGSAGLAGLLALSGELNPGQRVVVLFTGKRRCDDG